MADNENMTVILPALVAAQIRAAIESGEYNSTSEVVGDAVRQLFGQRHLQPVELDQLRRAWDSGKASGEHGPLNFDDLRQEARERLASAKDRSGNVG